MSVATPRTRKKKALKVLTLRDAQLATLERLGGVRYGQCEAPTGSGKSISARLLAHDHLAKHPDAVVVIAVPQHLIAAGFLAETWVYHPDMGEIHLPQPVKVTGRKDFISNTTAAGVYVTTHATLARSLEESDFTNTLIVIDEAHRLAEVGGANPNVLGKRLTQFLRDTTNRLLAFSATNFRNDGAPTLANIKGVPCEKMKIDLIDHLAENTVIDQITPEVVACHDFMTALRDYYQTYTQDPTTLRDVIWVPPTHSGDAFADKHKVRDEYFAILNRVYGYNKVKSNPQEPGVYYLYHPTRSRLCVLDFIDDIGGISTKQAHDLLQADQVHAVLAMNRFVEGADWPSAHRGIVLGARGSIVGLIQMMGRLLRGHPDKTSVTFTQIFQAQRDTQDETFTVAMKKYITPIIMTLILQELVAMPTVRTLRQTRTYKSSGPRQPHPMDGIGMEDRTKMSIAAAELITALTIKHADDLSQVKDQFLAAFQPADYTTVPLKDSLTTAEYLFDGQHKPKLPIHTSFDAVGTFDVVNLSPVDTILYFAMKRYGVTDMKALRDAYYAEQGRPIVSLERAREICAENGITTQAQYKKRYKDFEGLPSHPDAGYGMPWNEFIGKPLHRFKDQIVSLDEAQKICAENGITSFTQYQARYKDFEGLPSSADVVYGCSWNVLFGKSTRRMKTLSLVEAQQICTENGITDGTTYRKRYKEFEGLSSHPNRKYGIKWSTFFDKREKNIGWITFKEAQKICATNKITTAKEYQARYKDFEGLPSNPDEIYNISWAEFFGKTPKRRKS
jgi:Type III restriction enzyme, res subunit/Phage-integrase repeat unit